MKTPITYYGGKQQLASDIISMMPKHHIYVEPFFGGGAVFFAKGPSPLERINDHNDVLMNFYEVCQDEVKFQQLQVLIQTTLDSEKSWLKARRIFHHPEGHTQIDIAWAVWLTTNMSFSGSPRCGWKWDNGTSGSHSGITMDNYRNAFTKRLFERLRYVQISSRDAITVIKQRDSKETFFYLDPPYPGCEQQHYKGFSYENLEELLVMLSTVKGHFILSNYHSRVLDKYIKTNKWSVKEIDLPLKVANFNVPRRKKEILVYNYVTEPQLFTNTE